MTRKQQRFIQEYLVDLNATQAAIRAGYSKDTAYQIGFNLLKNVDIESAIEKAMEERGERTQITADNVIKELGKIAFSNMSNYVRISGGDPCIDLTDCTLDQMAVISEVTSEDYTDGRGEDARDVKKTKIKLHDKKGALVDLGRHFGIFVDKIEVSDSAAFDTVGEALAEAGVSEQQAAKVLELVGARIKRTR